MNVIVGVIVDSVNTSRLEIENEDIEENENKKTVTLESISTQIEQLQKNIEELKRK